MVRSLHICKQKCDDSGKDAVVDDLSRSVLERFEAGLAANTAATQANAALTAQVAAELAAVKDQLVKLNGRTGKTEEAVRKIDLRHAEEDGADKARGSSFRRTSALVGLGAAVATVALGAAAYVNPPG